MCRHSISDGWHWLQTCGFGCQYVQQYYVDVGSAN